MKKQIQCELTLIGTKKYKSMILQIYQGKMHKKRDLHSEG